MLELEKIFTQTKRIDLLFSFYILQLTILFKRKIDKNFMLYIDKYLRLFY